MAKSTKKNTTATVKTQQKTCFVAMPFTKEDKLQVVYERSIEPAVEEAGFQCIRSDKIQESGIVLDHIVRSTYEADVIIADMTQCNPNVMYELGLSHGLGKNVIILSQKKGEAPFDLKPFRVVYYNNEMGEDAKLKAEILSRLKAVNPDVMDRTNPVSLFVGEGFSHMDVARYRKRVEFLESAGNEHHELTRTQKEEIAKLRKEAGTAKKSKTALEKEIAQLKEEKAEFKGRNDLAESILGRLGALESLEQLRQQVEAHPEDDSVTISVEDKAGTRARVKFHRVPPNKRRDIPPRNQ